MAGTSSNTRGAVIAVLKAMTTLSAMSANHENVRTGDGGKGRSSAAVYAASG